ncbi:amidohydrolase family protein [Taibaiella helva]|uniref:amidohydrolase family protein n=1 Tax=Taibaiella helva TaxID=2301235 RepID=UPI000E583D94|nr:amidohydrolase family protein [Taibaiella helva]
MFYFGADRIHNGYQWLEPGTVISTDEHGTIVAVLAPGMVPADADVRHFEGILCPGFVNVHCHLELSHMKGAIPEGTRLVPFLQSVMTGRGLSSAEEKAAAIQQAIAESRQNGIVAVGDIANATDTLLHRQDSGLHIHTFIESIGFTETSAADRFAWPLKVYEQFAAQQSTRTLLRQSIVPHAPYSVSAALFRLINAHAPGGLLSVHNEETAAENELYRHKEGEMFDLYRTLNIDAGFFQPSGQTSLQTYLPQLPDRHPVILVHNTFMEEEDLVFLKTSGKTVYLCLCPNANWYIERRMPPAQLFLDSGVPVCLGTDSLASNHELSIWAEIQTLQQHFPALPLETLLRWGTANGAQALQMDTVAGSFAPGKRPGIVHIDSRDRIAMVQ